MKLLVLDRSRLLSYLVERIVPEYVEVVFTQSFVETMQLVENRKADAVVAELRNCTLPWRELQMACCEREPHIPILFQSSTASRVEDTCLQRLCSCHRFISEPYHADELRSKVFEILNEARRHARLEEGTAGSGAH